MAGLQNNWKVVLEDGQAMLNGNNIVLENKLTKEIGYLEDTPENRSALDIPLAYKKTSEQTINKHKQIYYEDDVESEPGTSSMIYQPSPHYLMETDVLEDMEDTLDDDQETSFFWSINKIKLLLSLYLERKEKFRNPKIKKKVLWREISEKMGISELICDKKFRNLKSTYIRLLQKKKKSGRGAVCWVYFDIFDEIYKMDKNVNPTMKQLDTLKPITFQEKQNKSLEFSKLERNKHLVKPRIKPTPLTSQNEKVSAINEYLDSTVQDELETEESSIVNKGQPRYQPINNINTPTMQRTRARRYDAYRQLTEDIRDRQIRLEQKFDSIVDLIKESNNIQKERNDYFKQFLEKKMRLF